MVDDGIELKVARIRAGLRQYELAARLGISQPRLCEIEAGRRAVTPEMAERLKNVLANMARSVREGERTDVSAGVSEPRPEVEPHGNG